MISLPHRSRFILVAVAGMCLLIGLWSGLTRLEWDLPKPQADFDSLHGPLMVVGFLGTLIGLERAVAINIWWAYGVPFFSCVSMSALLMDAPLPLIAATAFLAAVLLTLLFADLYRRQPGEHFVIITISAALFGIGDLLWLAEAPLSQVAPWWSGFLVLTIAGERLELTRLRQPPSYARWQFRACVAIILAGLTISIFSLFLGVRVAGAGLVVLALWLLRYDLAWQNLHTAGLPRFMARCLIIGYVWLAIGGVLWLAFAPFFAAGPIYDAMLHVIFVGFVFSMIFAHGPVILPAITGMKLAFQNLFYLHVALLHLGLILRLAGDFDWVFGSRKWGGALNALAILLFIANNIRAVKIANRA